MPWLTLLLLLVNALVTERSRFILESRRQLAFASPGFREGQGYGCPGPR
ncbi:MAG: hypothetical protein ACYST0_00365 [Planctomycetota bacterium]